MPVAGLVVNLSQDQQLAARAIETIQAKSVFTLGDPPRPDRYPVVMESADQDHAKDLLQWLQTIPGILDVQVVSVDCSDLPAQSPDSYGQDHASDLPESPSPPPQEPHRHDA